MGTNIKLKHKMFSSFPVCKFFTLVNYIYISSGRLNAWSVLVRKVYKSMKSICGSVGKVLPAVTYE